jgi:hypothetical protein
MFRRSDSEKHLFDFITLRYPLGRLSVLAKDDECEAAPPWYIWSTH